MSKLVCAPLLLATVVDETAAVDAAADVELRNGDYLMNQHNTRIIAHNPPDLDDVELDDVDVELLL